MSEEEEIAFDDWEAEADVAVEETKAEENVQEEPKPEAEAPQQESEASKTEKAKVVDPHQVLLDKINTYKQLDENQFDVMLESKLTLTQMSRRTAIT